MAIKLKNKKEIEVLREAGKILAKILEELSRAARVGVSAVDLNNLANELCQKYEVRPTFLNYKPEGANRPYPASLCVSINDEVVHGIPNEGEPKILKDGDLVSLDMGIEYQGLIVDSAVTVGVGEMDPAAKKLLAAGEEARAAAIAAARIGGRTGDIGAAIEKVAQKYGFSTVKDLGGHGVGYAVHEDPFIPNFDKAGEGVVLKEGMVLAIEPMLNEGTDQITLDDDGYTFRTADGKRSVHFEHTAAITPAGPEILTT